MIRNLHQRDVGVPAGEAGALLDSAGGPDDAIWPAPAWPALVLDLPLRAGSAGGHGPIRYHLARYRPGRMLEFAFDPGGGLDGTHMLTVEPLGPDSCRIRHELRGRLTGSGRVRRPVVRAVDVPSDGLLPGALDRVDAADAFAVDVADGLPRNPQWWADRLFRDPPGPVVALMALREAVVGLAGIERATGDEFTTRERTADEVLLGADAGHLDFRAVVRREPGRVVLGTAVALRNGRGRLYWSVVRRVHPLVVRTMLARAAARAGSSVPCRESAIAAGERRATLRS